MINSIFNEKAVVVSNKLIAFNTYEATMLSPKISKSVFPGQFINILPNNSWDKVMRRPMSVSSSNKDLISIIYKSPIKLIMISSNNNYKHHYN